MGQDGGHLPGWLNGAAHLPQRPRVYIPEMGSLSAASACLSSAVKKRLSGRCVHDQLPAV